MELERWERLIQDDDDSRVWKTVDWKGNYSASAHGNGVLPSDAEFRNDYFEKILNPTRVIETELPDLRTDVSIPMLDESIFPLEVHHQVKKMKVDKACGPNGIPHGVFSLLPTQWIATTATLFSTIFTSAIFLIHRLELKYL